MYEFVLKIWAFLRKIIGIVLIIGGVVFWVWFAVQMFGGGKNISNNGDTTDAVREQLGGAEQAKQDIADTATGIGETTEKIEEGISGAETAIRDATATSSKFDDILRECENILEQIRGQEQ